MALVIILFTNFKEGKDERKSVGLNRCRRHCSQACERPGQVPDASLAAVTSRTYERAKNFADKYGAKVYKTAEELIADEKCRSLFMSCHS